MLRLCWSYDLGDQQSFIGYRWKLEAIVRGIFPALDFPKATLIFSERKQKKIAISGLNR